MKKWHLFQKRSLENDWCLFVVIGVVAPQQDWPKPAVALGIGVCLKWSKDIGWKSAGSLLGEVFLLLKKEAQGRDSFCHSSGCRCFWVLHRGLPQPSSKAVLDPTEIEDCRVEEWNKWNLCCFVELLIDPSLGFPFLWTSSYRKW